MQDGREADLAAVVLGVDPGRRVGLAWVDAAGRLLRSEVVDEAALRSLATRPDLVVAVGDGTGSRAVRAALAGMGAPVITVDERASSEEGRRLYWRDHPPHGWQRLLPAGMRTPPRPIDDYAAYAIALRWLAAPTDR